VTAAAAIIGAFMHRIALPALALLLVACQSAPQPFADSRPPASPNALTPPDSVGIAVAPPSGAPPAMAAALAQAMAQDLQNADVPASVEFRNRRSFQLSGTVTAAPLPGERLAVTIVWELTDPQGKRLGGATAHLQAAADPWRLGGVGIAQALAKPAAPQIAKLVASDAPLPQGSVNPVVALGGITGAPGDGAHSLALAMAEALKRVHVGLASPAGGSRDFLLTASVEVAAADGQKQRVRVSWALLRPDGSEVGRVNQENAVPAGSLNGAWGQIAYAVTNAAAPGVRQLIEEAVAAPTKPS